MATVVELLERCLAARAALFDAEHTAAFRLFSGFTEGLPELVIDLYGATAILTNYADPPPGGQEKVEAATVFLREALPWLRCGILKVRNSESIRERRGVNLFGSEMDRRVREHGVWYAVNPVMHQDTGLYLDTRNVRRWALDHLHGQSVLNAFAYTGSLGVAARAGGARQAVQLDRNRGYLEMARESCKLNGLSVGEGELVCADFFRQVGRFKQQRAAFDCVFLDPPFFSKSSGGVVDQIRAHARLINKVRPLLKDGGRLVAINNALYVSGSDYTRSIEALSADGYLKLSEIISVPDDSAGYAETRVGSPITDPAPFNHSTKIVVLEVRRKTAIS